MPISEDPEAAKAKASGDASDAPAGEPDLRKLLDVALYGTGVDLKAVKGPRGQLLTKQETKAQRDALEEYTSAALALGPRKSLLDGSPSQLREILDLALGKSKPSKEGALPVRTQALSCVQALAWATPLLIEEPLQNLIALHADAKMGKPSLDAATDIITKFTPKGHGVVQLVLPIPMKLIDDKNWKVRVVGLKLLSPCLAQMQHTAKQLSELLSRLLPQLLAGPLMEPRKEIQEAAKEVLEVVGTLVRNSEVNALSKDVVRAVADPANQKHTQDALAKLGSTTFMNYIDAASLALLIPIMARGLKEREQKSRKWSAQILGAIVTLVKDIEYLRPYLPSLLPMLKECAVDPTYEIQREAAKAFGMLTQELPDWSRAVLQPWACEGVISKDLGVALGCAHSLSEVLLRLGRRSRDGYVKAIIAGARSPDGIERRGFLLLLDFIVEALKNDFVPYIRSAFPVMLAGVLPEPDDPGLRVCEALISRFGATCPELLLPGIEDLFFACQHEKSFVFPTAMKHQGVYEAPMMQWVIRETYLRLFLKLCDKILDYRKYGQDMLTCDDCSTRKTREQILVLLEAMKEDSNAQVQRQAKHILRHCGGQAKLTKEIMPAIEAKLLEMRQDPSCEPKRLVANSLLNSLLEAGEIGGGDAAAYIAALPVAPELIPPVDDAQKGQAHKDLVGLLAAPTQDVSAQKTETSAEEVDGDLDADTAAKGEDREAMARAGFCGVFAAGSWDAAGEGAEDARKFCETMAASVSVEALSSRGLFGELKLKVQAVASKYAAGIVSENDMVACARSVARAVFGQDSLTEEDEQEGSEIVTDTLLKVEDMMLMYGGGHLLLKDTCLEIRKSRRYGIIGHNGCGKTTLMKELQAGRVAGMPKDIRCVHVSDADLGNMKVLEMTSISFVEKDRPQDGGISAEDALIQVGFPKDMQDKPVSDLSGGWRMRLLLAAAMLKRADILLLDEPTNHLDVHAIEWLCKFLLSVKTGSLMVISHDPHFLNAVCTDIVQYRDKKLVYYKGNFDAFKQANAISDDDAEVLLAGNLSLDRERAADGAAATNDKQTEDATDETGKKSSSPAAEESKVVDTILEEPKAAAAKLVFPIPGKLDGIRNNSKPVMEIKDVYFEYPGGRGQVIKGVSCKLNLGSRVALVGVNGAGKSTLLGLMCGELNPTEHDGVLGEVWQHHNLRLSFIAQHHMTSLGRWFESTPFTYLSYRFQNGWDEEAQRHLIDPKDEEEAKSRKEKAGIHGKYGKQIGAIVGRSVQQKKIVYEVQWEGMEDQKQNTFETMDKIRALGCEGVASACNLRLAAISGGVDTRVCSRREIVKHLEAFGIDEEMCCNRLIGSFSAGQKSKLAIACSMWTKPHVLALDEPTNYLDQETVESLARALRNFRGGVVVVTHSQDFIDKVCSEEWLVADGKVTVQKSDASTSSK